MARPQKRVSMLYCKVCAQRKAVINLRDQGIIAIENLMQKKGKFDYILLETTGLAGFDRFVSD